MIASAARLWVLVALGEHRVAASYADGFTRWYLYILILTEYICGYTLYIKALDVSSSSEERGSNETRDHKPVG